MTASVLHFPVDLSCPQATSGCPFISTMLFAISYRETNWRRPIRLKVHTILMCTDIQLLVSDNITLIIYYLHPKYNTKFNDCSINP